MPALPPPTRVALLAPPRHGFSKFACAHRCAIGYGHTGSCGVRPAMAAGCCALVYFAARRSGHRDEHGIYTAARAHASRSGCPAANQRSRCHNARVPGHARGPRSAHTDHRGRARGGVRAAGCGRMRGHNEPMIAARMVTRCHLPRAHAGSPPSSSPTEHTRRRSRTCGPVRTLSRRPQRVPTAHYAELGGTARRRCSTPSSPRSRSGTGGGRTLVVPAS